MCGLNKFAAVTYIKEDREKIILIGGKSKDNTKLDTV